MCLLKSATYIVILALSTTLWAEDITLSHTGEAKIEGKVVYIEKHEATYFGIKRRTGKIYADFGTIAQLKDCRLQN